MRQFPDIYVKHNVFWQEICSERTLVKWKDELINQNNRFIKNLLSAKKGFGFT